MSRDRWYDVIAVILMATVAILFWLEPVFLTLFRDDMSYHVLVAEHYNQAGGIVTHSYWEALPEGRPQNYPPLFHLLLSFVIKAGVDPYHTVLVGALFGISGSLLLIWYGLKKLFDSGMALLTIVILTNFLQYILLLGVVVPASLVLAASPLLLYLVINKRVMGATLILVLMLYTHMLIPWCIIGTLCVTAFFYKEYRQTITKALLIALVAYIPWGINVISSLHYIKYLTGGIDQRLPPTIDILVLGLSMLALIALRNKRPLGVREFFFFILLGAQAAILFTAYPSRFTASGGYLCLAIITALFLKDLLRHSNKLVQYGTLLVIIVLFFNTIIYGVNSDTGKRGFFKQPSTIPQAIKIYPARDLNYLNHSAFLPEHLAIADIVKKNSDSKDVIYGIFDFFDLDPQDPIKLGYPMERLSALSQRSMANARPPETLWLPPFDMTKAKIVIADYRQTPEYSGAQTAAQKETADTLSTGFIKVGQVDRLTVYKNTRPNTLTISISPVKINQWLALVLFVILIAAIIRDVRSGEIPSPKIEPLSMVPEAQKKLRI